MEEIETERTKHDFISAESLNDTNNHLQQEVNLLRKKLNEREILLSNDTFYAELELRDQMIPLTIIIDRKTGRAKVKINSSKNKW